MPSLRVQTGGGIRDESQVTALLKAGVQRVIVGSLAVRSPDLVRGWLKSFGPEKIILSPDVRLDAAGVPRIAAAGWQETTGVVLDDLLHSYLPAGLVHILCTDISRDGKLVAGETTTQKMTLTQVGTSRTFHGLLARTPDGGTALWIGRRKRVGEGEGWSGLRFDTALPPDTP